MDRLLQAVELTTDGQSNINQNPSERANTRMDTDESELSPVVSTRTTGEVQANQWHKSYVPPAMRFQPSYDS